MGPLSTKDGRVLGLISHLTLLFRGLIASLTKLTSSNLLYYPNEKEPFVLPLGAILLEILQTYLFTTVSTQ